MEWRGVYKDSMSKTGNLLTKYSIGSQEKFEDEEKISQSPSKQRGEVWRMRGSRSFFTHSSPHSSRHGCSHRLSPLYLHLPFFAYLTFMRAPITSHTSRERVDIEAGIADFCIMDGPLQSSVKPCVYTMAYNSILGSSSTKTHCQIRR